MISGVQFEPGKLSDKDAPVHPITIKVTVRRQFLVFRIEGPTLGDSPKPHKSACSGRLPSSVTQAQKWSRNIVMPGHQCAQTWSFSTRLTARPGTRLKTRISLKALFFP